MTPSPGNDSSLSVASRVPVEIWTKIISELVESLASVGRSKRDPSYTRVVLADAWKACRSVSRKVKAGTEAGFTQQLLVNSKPRHLHLGLRLSHQGRQDYTRTDCGSVRIEFSHLSRRGDDNSELWVVWKYPNPVHWDKLDQFRFLECKYILGPGQTFAEGDSKSGWVTAPPHKPDWYGPIDHAYLDLGDRYFMCCIKLPGLTANVSTQEVSFPWIRALNKIFSQ